MMFALAVTPLSLLAQSGESDGSATKQDQKSLVSEEDMPTNSDTPLLADAAMSTDIASTRLTVIRHAWVRAHRCQAPESETTYEPAETCTSKSHEHFGRSHTQSSRRIAESEGR